MTRPFNLMRSPWWLFVVAAICLIGPTVGRADAQQQQQEKFENLKVLPQDISHDSLIQVMRGFALGLGVRCAFCHASEPVPPGGPAGGPTERLVFKSDDKIEKRTARFMLRMVDSLNHVTLPTLADRHDPPIVVVCATCHRGSPLPQTLDMVLASVIDHYGVDSAVTRYKQLREDMVYGRYDFSEQPVDELARRLSVNGKTAEAIAMLRMNQQYYPASPDIDFQLAEIYVKRGAKDSAIQCYRADLAKRPDDNRAKRRLTELGASPSGG